MRRQVQWAILSAAQCWDQTASQQQVARTMGLLHKHRGADPAVCFACCECRAMSRPTPS